jgi:CheY-like chemotaxis protein
MGKKERQAYIKMHIFRSVGGGTIVKELPLILILEYDTQKLSYMLNCVKQAGCAAISGHTGQDGLQLLHVHKKWGGFLGNRISAIICSAHMPEMDGLAFVQKKQQSFAFRKIPVVMVTQENTDQSIWKDILHKSGVDRLLPKSFTKVQLETILGEVVHC